MLKRAWTIYCVHLGIMGIGFLLIALFGNYFAMKWQFPNDVWATLWQTLTLQFKPNNVLPMYVYLLALGSISLPLIRRGWSLPLFLGALAIYIDQQADAWRLGKPEYFDGDFHILPRLLPFLICMAAGYHFETVKSKVTKAQQRWFIYGCLVFAGIIFVIAQLQRDWSFNTHIMSDDLEYWLFGRPHASVGGRLYAWSILIVSAWALPAILNHKLGSRVGGWLSLLGRNSLYLFIIQSGIWYLPPALFIFNWPLWAQDAATLVIIVGLYHMAKHGVGRRWIPN